MRLRFALLGALFVSLPSWGQDAAQWMARMSQALATLDYHGDLVYSHAGQIEALRLFHTTGPNGERERLVSVSGVPREVIRDGGRIVCIGTGAVPSAYSDASAAPLLGALPGPSGSDLQQHYVLVLGDIERIAGLEAQQIAVRPRDAYRYGYRLWLERTTGLPLKSLRFGADGRPVEQIMFTRIALNERPTEADLGSVSVEGATQIVLNRPQPVAATPGWHVIDPPAGFALRLQRPQAADASVHLVYSDGIANVSVYVEPLRAQVPAFSGAASRGALNLYGRVIEGRQITVLGDVPAATVERFAQGVTAAGG